MGLGVGAGGAHGRGGRAFHGVAAVAAAPGHLGFPLENPVVGHVGRQGPIALLMIGFGHRHGLKDRGDLRETLISGGLGKTRIHLGIFVVLTFGGGQEIFQGAADLAGREAAADFYFAPLQELEEPLGVLLFLVGGLFKDKGDLDKAFFLGFGGKIGLAVAGLGFAGEGGEEISFRLGASE
jgi:hypothetical protein